MTTTIVRTREQTIRALRKRDGDMCQYPGAEHILDFAADDGPTRVTIDHWMPRWRGRELGWSEDKINDLDNLKLMCKRHNAKKGERIPNDDGTLPERPAKKAFRNKREKVASRPDYCVQCNNGHNLFADEICASCGCNAQRFPMSAKVSYPECDHEILWCWVCSITPEMRPAAVDMALLQGESGEWDAK